jgi:hypothetical protein
MLHKCANPACSNLFRRLREGKLFQVETKHFASSREPVGSSRRNNRHVEHYWLCDECAPFVTLAFDQREGMLVVPLSRGLGSKIVTILPQPGSEAGAAAVRSDPPTMFNRS